MTISEAMSEADLLQAIREIAPVTGWGMYHTYNSQRSNPGFPDLVLWNPRRRLVVFAELKSQTGKLSIDQADVIDALRAAGADVRVWRPSDLDEAIELLMGRSPRNAAR